MLRLSRLTIRASRSALSRRAARRAGTDRWRRTGGPGKATSARHALGQQPVEDLDALDPEVGEPVIVQRHAARQPPIGDVALGKPLQFARRPHPFDRRVKPPRKDRRPVFPLRPRAREPERKAAKDRGSRRNSIPCARDGPPQQTLKIDHIPAQLTPIRPQQPSFLHRRFHRISHTESQPKRKRQFLHTLACGNDNTTKGPGLLGRLRQAPPGRKPV
jgi:hypothetical protein